MKKFELHTAAGFKWPQEVTLYSLVELIFRDAHRPPVSGIVTGVGEAIQLDRAHLYTHNELTAVNLLKRHEEVL